MRVAVAGRMMLKRVMGKASFATLQDMTGQIQVYVSNDATGAEAHEAFKHWDLGDILGVEGTLFKTRTGELTVNAARVRLLAKSLRPLPEKFHGLADQEQKYRSRYLDLITSEEARRTFAVRSRLIQAIRAYMIAQGFLEVETPMMQPIPGGAAARPFVTHHNALDMTLYLRIAPELYLKRLVVGGFEKVFEINRNFRNEGISTRHNPEFTMLEYYEAYRDFRYLMDFNEALLRAVALEVLGTTSIPYGEHTVDLAQPFARLTITEAIRRHHPRFTEADLASRDVLVRELTKLGIEPRAGAELGELQLTLFEETTEQLLIQPTYIVDYPAVVSPLARRNDANPDDYRPLRAVHHRARDGERLLGAQRPGGPGRPLRGTGAREGGGRRGGDVLRRRLHPRARARAAADGRLRHRDRPPRDAVHEQPVHPRRHPLPPHAPGGVSAGEAVTVRRRGASL